MWGKGLLVYENALARVCCCAAVLGTLIVGDIDADSTGLHPAAHWNGKPIPIWLWTDYAKMPGFIELNIEVWFSTNSCEFDFI